MTFNFNCPHMDRGVCIDCYEKDISSMRDDVMYHREAASEHMKYHLYLKEQLNNALTRATDASLKIEGLEYDLATVKKERDEYNTARLALIADLDKMWDERHKAQQESNNFRNERDAIWHSYQECRQQLAAMTKERDRLEASQRSAWNAAVLKDEQLTACQQQRDELEAAAKVCDTRVMATDCASAIRALEMK